MYQNIFVDKKSWTVHLWDDVEGYKAFPYKRYAYCRKQGGKYKSLYGDELEKIFHFENNPQLFESDVAPEMRVLIDKYENSDDPSEGHKVVVIDIEVDSTGGFPDIEKGDKPITAIAIYDQVADYYYSFVLDPDGKIKNSVQNNSTTYSFVDEDTLLRAFLNKWDEIKPTILSGWNCIPLNQTVWTKNKIVKIGDLNDNCLYDSNLLQKYPISVKEKWSIELENGKKIYSSGNHKFPVIMVNSNEYVTFNRSKNSNFIELDLTTKQIRSFGKDNSIFCAVQMRKNTNLDNPKYTMENLYLAGLIYTDGSIKDKKSLNGGYKFYQSDYEFMKKLDNFGIISEISGPIKNCYSRNIKREFIGNAHNLIYSDRNKKQMHLEELSTLSYKQFMMFLSGLLDGDGCKHKTTVGWCNFNGDIDTIHQLCNWNNIFCTERKNHLYFIDFNYKDLSLLKNKRWKNIKIKSLKRESKQKSSQIKYKRIKDTYWVKVKKVNYIGTSTRMMDIKTDTNYFITSGIKTHNCNGFDAPYLYNRIREVIGRTAAYRLSPIGIAYQNTFTKRMIIAGISCLDYMDLYKKFIGTTKPSYSLANVAKDEELKHQKLTYRGSLTQLYKEDLSRYVEYNLVDVKVVVELDQKYDFIHLAQAVCHKGHVPYEWFQMSSRFIDGAILMYLRRHNLVAPNKPIGGREEYEEMERGGKEGFTGAFVKDPIPGLYDWVTSADITSLYPSTIMSLNISPETKMDKILNWSAMDFINGDLPILRSLNKEYTSEEFKKMIKDYNYSIASNGVIYKQDMRGVIPTILDQWFSERVEYRKKAKDFGKNGDKVQEAFYDRRQKRQKIFLNSVYGVLGLPIFRFYDRDNAEAVTTSGQEIIRSAERLVNDIYDEKYKENGVEPPTNDHVIYIDTDSVTGDSTLKLENGENINICNVFDNVDVTKEISDISGRHFKFPSNLNLPYYDEELQKVLYGKVKYIEKHKTSKKVYKLKTKTGKSIKVTEDHSLMVIENGKLVKKTAKEVKKGDKIISI